MGLERCRLFLSAQNPLAATHASAVIARQLLLLEIHPEAGRPHPEERMLRELLIDFGASGYVALYRHDRAADAVYILAFRHQKEAGY
jgi:plasmid stabilization system protein ParE